MSNLEEDWQEPYYFFEQDWHSWEQLRETFEWRVPSRINIAKYLCDRHANQKNRVAVFYEDESGREGTLTYWQLKNYSNQLANFLEKRGVGFGDRVGVCLPQKPETLIAHLGIWKLGAVSVPLSVLFGSEGLAYRLRDSETEALVVDESNLGTVRAIRERVPTLDSTLIVGDEEPEEAEREFWKALREQGREREFAETRAEDDLMIFYTSGTTGDPKGVVHAHRMPLGHLPAFVCMFGRGGLRPERNQGQSSNRFRRRRPRPPLARSGERCCRHVSSIPHRDKVRRGGANSRYSRSCSPVPLPAERGLNGSIADALPGRE